MRLIPSHSPDPTLSTDDDAIARAVDRARRLEDLGCLARGYGHELNNRLAVILGGLSQIEDHLGAASGRCAGDLATVRQAAAEAIGFVRQIEVFTLGSEPIRSRVIQEDWLAGIWPALPRRADVVYACHCPDDLPVIAVDPVQLERALANLLSNANAAITGGDGRVALDVSVANEGGRAMMIFSVTDNGTGVDPSLLPRLADPYFTTRQGENATGLGLTVCEAMARAHGGHLRIHSQPGRGTTVVMSFPLEADGGYADPGPTVNHERGDAGRAFPCKVLVLEDEPMVRRALASSLERAGCEVVETSTGEEAVEAWLAASEAEKPVVVVVSDLTIRGGMGGTETIRRLRALDPGLRAIACSGYSDDPVMSSPERFGFFSALPKPFEPAELVAAVAAAAATR